MEIKVYAEDGTVSSSIEVNDAIFSSEINENVIYEAIKNELANARLGTHSAKSRSYISGGGSKPWRQKGTGNARAGTRRSPLWTGGGVVHPPTPRDYSYVIPKKVKRLAYLSIFSVKKNEDAIKVYEDFNVEKPETKRFSTFLKLAKKDTTRRIVFIVGKSDSVSDENYRNLILSLRNIKDVKVVNVNSLRAHPIFYSDEVFMTKSAMLSFNDVVNKSYKFKNVNA